MNDRYAGSFFLSLLLHVSVAVLLFAIAFLLHPREPEEVKLFEVVDGPGDNYMATEAPSSPPVSDPSFELDLPDPLPEPPVVVPEPVIVPEPVVIPDPVPVTPKPIPTPKPVPTPPKPPVPTPPKPPAPTPPKPPVVTPKPRTTMTKEEFDKKFAKTTNASQSTTPKPPTTVKPKLIDPNAVTNGLRNSTDGGGGDALTAQVRSQMDGYFSRLLALLKKNHQKPAGLSDQLEATFSYHVSAAGKVSQVRVVRSSGNRTFDDSVLAAFATLPNLGARPDGKSGSREVVFRMRDVY